MALKKCKDCGKEISTDAGKCPNCGKPQTKSSTKVFLILILLFVIFIIITSFIKPSSTPSPQNSSEDINLNASDEQIYREFEVCMNSSKKIIDENKLEGQRIAAGCMTRLNKYGKDRASKAFKMYFDM